jgi:hypothetical protein
MTFTGGQLDLSPIFTAINLVICGEKPGGWSSLMNWKLAA